MSVRGSIIDRMATRVKYEYAFLAVDAADFTAADLPAARAWLPLGAWQYERLEDKRPMYFNLTNYGQASYRTDFVKEHVVNTSGVEHTVWVYEQKNKKYMDMVFRLVLGPVSVNIRTAWNDEKSKIAVIYDRALTGETMHVSVHKGNQPIRIKAALELLADAMAVKGVHTRQQKFYYPNAGHNGWLWNEKDSSYFAEPAAKKPRLNK